MSGTTLLIERALHERISTVIKAKPLIAMSNAATTPLPTAQLELMGSRQFPNWLAEQQVSLAFTTYQTGKLFLIGLQPNGRLSIFERTFNRAMGLHATAQTLYLSSLYQLWRFDNVLPAGQDYQGYDRLYVPQVGYITGDLDIHDVAVPTSVEGIAPGKPIFVNTLFGCLATVSETHSFKPLWKPHFISKLAAEDRCHLNGLAMKDGKPAYVSAVSQSDVADGWRDHRQNGGCIIDVNNNTVITTGLSMPHSPRWHNGKLWVANSGAGYLGTIDLTTGEFESVVFCPGYIRGLSFIGDFAVVGLSQPRHNKTFSGLALDDELAKRDAEPRSGLQVIDLRTGDVVHWLRVEGMVAELYDVAAIAGVRRPMAIGFKTDEIRRMITIAN